MNWVVCANVNRTWDFLSSPESTSMRKLSQIQNSTSSKSLHEAFQRIKLERVEREVNEMCVTRVTLLPYRIQTKDGKFYYVNFYWMNSPQSEWERGNPPEGANEKKFFFAQHTTAPPAAAISWCEPRERRSISTTFFSTDVCSFEIEVNDFLEIFQLISLMLHKTHWEWPTTHTDDDWMRFLTWNDLICSLCTLWSFSTLERVRALRRIIRE